MVYWFFLVDLVCFKLRLLLTKQAMFKRELLAMRDADVFLLGFALRLFII